MEARMDGTLEQRLLWRIEALREALEDIRAIRDGVSNQIANNALGVDDHNAKLCVVSVGPAGNQGQVGWMGGEYDR